MSYNLIGKILIWLTPSKRIDNEISQATDDIAFLTNKIHLARRMYADVIAKKLVVQRDKLIEKRTRLMARRSHLFNK